MLDSALFEHYLEQATDLRDALSIPHDAPLELAPLGQGEYNANFSFVHPLTAEKLVLRANFGSQLHLEQQITYEYQALKLLETSGRTPHPYYVDDTKALVPYGMLVMEYCAGRHLRYDEDLASAAAILADVHATPIPSECHLIRPSNPLQAIIDECTAMFDIYESSDYASADVLSAVGDLFIRARHLAQKGIRLQDATAHMQDHIISTELNSTNFLIREGECQGSLVDWEKPIAGEVAQDLAHFLAPTTTFWKTDTFLSPAQMESFLHEYRAAADGRFATDNLEQRFAIYLPITCLRGITWCAMAYVEYLAPERTLKNESTFAKIKDYLSPWFLERILDDYR